MKAVFGAKPFLKPLLMGIDFEWAFVRLQCVMYEIQKLSGRVGRKKYLATNHATGCFRNYRKSILLLRTSVLGRLR